jgi:hypothetical protein
MWKQVDPDKQPITAPKVVAAYQHDSGYWLTAQANGHSTLWELRSPTGEVLTNQMDLPLGGSTLGAPMTWANTELANRKIR